MEYVFQLTELPISMFYLLEAGIVNAILSQMLHIIRLISVAFGSELDTNRTRKG